MLGGVFVLGKSEKYGEANKDLKPKIFVRDYRQYENRGIHSRQHTFALQHFGSSSLVN